MLDHELELKSLFKSAGCYCNHEANSIHHSDAKKVFQDFLNTWIASTSMITGSKKATITRYDDLDVRSTLKSLKPAQKLDLLLKIYDDLPLDPFGNDRLNTAHLTENAFKFIGKSVVPVRRCLMTHFGNDKAKFLKAYPTLPYASFNTKCTAAGVDKEECIPKKK